MKIPGHLAIIMDGNGRWACERNKARLYGHVKGALQLRKIISEVVRLKIPYLTLYAFSMENWLRPKEEVSILMKILVKFLRKERALLIKENVRLNTIGNISHLPPEARKELMTTLDATSDNTGLTLTLALSYSGRQDILQTAKRIALDYKEGNLEFDHIDESLFQDYLQTKKLPDPDLIIRTSNEHRLSNFLLWQSAYSEFYFTKKAWPDFQEKDLIEAILEYGKRERRFGKTSEQIHTSTGASLECH